MWLLIASFLVILLAAIYSITRGKASGYTAEAILTSILVGSLGVAGTYLVIHYRAYLRELAAKQAAAAEQAARRMTRRTIDGTCRRMSRMSTRMSPAQDESSWSQEGARDPDLGNSFDAFRSRSRSSRTSSTRQRQTQSQPVAQVVFHTDWSLGVTSAAPGLRESEPKGKQLSTVEEELRSKTDSSPKLVSSTSSVLSIDHAPPPPPPPLQADKAPATGPAVYDAQYAFLKAEGVARKSGEDRASDRVSGHDIEAVSSSDDEQGIDEAEIVNEALQRARVTNLRAFQNFLQQDSSVGVTIGIGAESSMTAADEDYGSSGFVCDGEENGRFGGRRFTFSEPDSV